MKTIALLATLATVTAIVIAGTSLAQVAGAPAFEFVGLWEGIDHVDGHEVAVSITPLDGDEFSVTSRSGHFGRCATDDPLTNGKGILNATGVIKDGVLVAERRILHCANGVEVDYSADFIPNTEHDLLTIHLRGARDNLVLHRISARPRGE